MTGSTNYHAGLAAEEAVARLYGGAGHAIAATRWRGKGGEIDLIAEAEGCTVFVEVKRARTHAEAAQRLGERQIARLHACAAEYMGTLPDGLLSDVRFDVALVDDAGRVEIVENALH